MMTIAELIREHALEITDTAELFDLIREHHPDVTPLEVAAELRRLAAKDFAHADKLKTEARRARIRAAVHAAWHNFHKARGRPEDELNFGNCVRELGIVELREGRQVLNFNNLPHVADPELRRVVLAAAWEGQRAQGRQQ